MQETTWFFDGGKVFLRIELTPEAMYHAKASIRASQQKKDTAAGSRFIRFGVCNADEGSVHATFSAAREGAEALATKLRDEYLESAALHHAEIAKIAHAQALCEAAWPEDPKHEAARDE